jgi:hypothetical protein
LIPAQLRNATSAYFPLTSPRLASFPDRRLAGNASGPTEWVGDDTFGSALYCRKGGWAGGLR